ncbi:MAG: ABC transporter permease [Acidobacteriia bacterium]|nr:ABC transporter permease [Terriglobia bacterium]
MLWRTLINLRFRELFRRERFEKEMDDELRFHLESMIKSNIQAGMTPKEAQRAARLAFGGVDQIKDDCRDTRWMHWLDQFWQDLRYALRILSRNPLSALITIVLIAVTIGLLCAAYAVLDAVVLRTLPVPHPEQLVVINPTAQIDSSIYDVLQRERQNISQIFGLKSLRLFGSAAGATRSFSIYGIKGDYFGAVGAIPQLGRFLAADEQNAVAVISDRLWRNEFAGTPDILGRNMKLGSLEVTIVGVAHRDFIAVEEPYLEWDAIVPWDIFCRALGTKRMPLQIVARLKVGKKAKEYEAQLNSLWPALLQATVPPNTTLQQWGESIGPRAQVVSISHGINYVLTMQPSIPLAIYMIFGLSILIFLSGCLALVLLAIARSIKYQHQTAIMLAIGGGRWHVQRPFFLEILILSGLGCAIGLAIAWWWSGLGNFFLPDSQSQSINWHVRIDGQAIKLALLMAMFFVGIISWVTLTFGFGNISSRILQHANSASRPNVRLRTGMLALQIAISVLLVQCALSFISTYSRLLHVPLGFDFENLHIYRLQGKLPKPNVPDNYFPDLITQIQQLPEVESAAITLSPPPLAFPLEFRQPVKTEDGREAQATIVCISSGYFRALKLPLLFGRDFSWTDLNTAIVNQTLLKKLYPDQDPLRHTIAFGKSGTRLQIIGVVGEMAYFGPRWSNSTIAFVPYVAPPRGGVSFMVRSKRNLEELRRPVQTVLDPPGVHYIYDSVDQKTLLSNSLQQERMLATIAGAFGGLIVLLAGVELYAFCNYLLAMRTKELAIRASVGAGPAQLAAALLKEVVRALGIGLTIGFMVALAGEHVLSNLAKIINPPEFPYLVFALVVVTGVTMSAVLMPILQAIRINLAKALRVD